jgi:hypothetical protein
VDTPKPLKGIAATVFELEIHLIGTGKVHERLGKTTFELSVSNRASICSYSPPAVGKRKEKHLP